MGQNHWKLKQKSVIAATAATLLPHLKYLILKAFRQICGSSGSNDGILIAENIVFYRRKQRFLLGKIIERIKNDTKDDAVALPLWISDTSAQISGTS